MKSDFSLCAIVAFCGLAAVCFAQDQAPAQAPATPPAAPAGPGSALHSCHHGPACRTFRPPSSTPDLSAKSP